jgi:ergothioneine biosynthesis protein EgtB
MQQPEARAVSNGFQRPGEPALGPHYAHVRRRTELLCAPLETEDYVLQSMPEASPVKWHLAHTAWFFETFVLVPHLPAYRPYDPEFRFLFNSYYDGVGPRWPRPQRGLLSRPTVREIYRYRAHVDQHVRELLDRPGARAECEGREPVHHLVELGLHHEQQHQELILTDLKHALAANPLRPAYHSNTPRPGASPLLEWRCFPEGVRCVGFAGTGFAFDNEGPRHRVFLEGFRLASRITTNGEYLGFIEDGGYERPELWLSDGWAARQARQWTAPLFWEADGGDWQVFTLSGRRPLDPAEPVCHVSYYEADAFARWAGARLPTEAEWETAATGAPGGHFQEAGVFHPQAAPAADDSGPLLQLYGDVWQWTASPYVAYPGYKPPEGPLGEYNGKFMCNQLVLRGASCATPRSHARRSYRNFFGPESRWQFSGVRLAQDLS